MAWGTAQKFYSYQRKCQAWVSYSQTANTDTSATFSVTGYARSGDGSGYYYAYDFGVTVRISYKVGNGSWTTLGSTTTVLNYGSNVGSTTKSFTVTKTHASQTVQVRCEAISTTSDWDTATSTLSISLNAKTSYTITLNANKPSAASASVTNMPANQTKWYGEALTLPNTTPTLSLYNFMGWNTVAAGTGTAYAAGGSYTSNAAATLYAQWELAYAYPTIDPATVIRCDSSGTEADDGAYGKVSFTWSIDTTADDGGNTGKRAVISWKPTTTSSWDNASSATITLSGTGGTVNRVFGTISTDTSYDVRIAVTDTHTIDGNECTAYRYLTLSQAFFTLDFLAGGHGVAMGVAATQEDTLEVALDFDHHDGGVTLDATAKAAWLDALGLGAPYYQNYGDYVNLYCWGHIAILTVVKSVTLNGSWASADICTVPEAYRPSRDSYASATLQDISTGNIALYIGTNGVAQAKVRGGTSPGSSAHYVCGTLVWSY